VKKTGSAVVKVKVPLKLKTGVFTYKISAEYKDKDAQLTGKIPVFSEKIFLDFYPENGKIINGIDSKISFYSYDACGSPLSVEADLLEDGKAIATFSSDSRGMGNFNLSPNFEKEYSVQIKRPLLLDKKYALPIVAAKGMALKVVSKTPESVIYNLISSYKTSRSIYLIGESDGKIFWRSQHEMGKEMQFKVDLSKAHGRLAHFVVLNAARRIEGEHVLLIEGKEPIPISIVVKNDDPSQRGKTEVDINASSLGKGDVFLTAVNSPWIVDGLVNQNIHALSLPYDISQQLVFQSGAFHESDFSDEILEVFSAYYVPFDFGWDKILKTEGAYTHTEANKTVSKNQGIRDQVIGKYKVEKSGGVITQSNLVADNYFTTSNPKYISSLNNVKMERVPSYKVLLEGGTPVLDVIQTMKPFAMSGTEIVFVGKVNSFNYQGGAIIAIDGVNKGTDASIISTLSPFEVDEIFVSTHPSDIQKYTGLNSVGLIEITLKRGGDFVTESEEIDDNMKFSAPEYENGKSGDEDDFRSTLYWMPGIEQDNDGKSKAVFYNSDLISKVKCKVFFIPENGKPSTSQFEYIIK